MILPNHQVLFKSRVIVSWLVVTMLAAATSNPGGDCPAAVPSWQPLQGETNPYCMVS